jgi:predicted RNA-binding Zn-ribbon protein involved in translation (DUF1610 family)
MSAWAYCTNCNAGIDRDNYSIIDICNDSYVCPQCGSHNHVIGVTTADWLIELEERVTRLEAIAAEDGSNPQP